VHFVIQGRPVPQPESQPQAAQSAISAGYLQTMRIPIVRGRGFVSADFGNAPPVALVTREAARQYWPDQDPIGQRIAFAGNQTEWIEVVGIADDVRNTGPFLAMTPQIYVPSSRHPERATAFVVRSAGADPVQLASSIRHEIAQLDKTQPVYDIKSMTQQLRDDLGGTYLITGMLAVFAIVALLLAAAGVYGVVSFSVSQRTREIGVRMALGARPASILGMVVARGSIPLAIGIVLGSAGAAALAIVTSQALTEIDLADPLAYTIVVVPLLAVALFATCIPARRATQVDPLVALRAE
jgi:putative ABC transport system permease protein